MLRCDIGKIAKPFLGGIQVLRSHKMTKNLTPSLLLFALS